MGERVKARHDAGDGALSEIERAELARLRKEDSELKMDWAFLKKSVTLLRPGSLGYEREAFALMHAEKSNFTLVRMARLLEVSRAGYYAWLTRTPSARALRAERIEAKIAWFHGESDEVSGSPRILVDLREDGEIISRKTVAKTMRRLGLKGVCPKKWRTTTVVNHADADAYPPDAAARAWDTGTLNRVWVGDITPTCAPGRDGSTWPPSSTPAGSLAGPSPSTCAPTWSNRPCRWRSRCAASCPRRSCSTPIAAPSTPAQITKLPTKTASPAPWDAPGCVGTTRWPNRSPPR